ncbi:hypothetical protein Q3G72_032826 [Acer saccharum]|nr:hypothetical protein Q3G72_032826 [Acer saccharum]
MAFNAILRKSASSLVPTASRLARANKNFYSAVFSASSHLNRKPILGSFVPDSELSSATEAKKCSSIIESLLQSINSEIKLLDDHGRVEESQSEFTLKIDEDTHKYDHTTEYHVVLTREYWGELVEVSLYDHTNGKGYGPSMVVTINNHGGSSLRFYCDGTSNAISIWSMAIINSENSKDLTEFSRGQNMVYPTNMDENLKKAFLEYLEIRGIKPSIVDSMIKCISNKQAKRKLMGLNKIKNFTEQLS